MAAVTNYDVIIVGSGLAGVMCALNLKSDINVLLVTKGMLVNSNSYNAQGGIAISWNKEEIECHVQDTLVAGHFENDEWIVRKCINSGEELLDNFLRLGVKFDKCEGKFHRTIEGGHHQNIILHAGGDATGKNIMLPLLYELKNRKNITVIENTEVLSVLKKGNRAEGISTKDLNIYAKCVVLALGGTGHMYEFSTNDKTITGDFIRIANDANIELENLDYVQFHPTGTSVQGRGFLISESLRGEGAILINELGERFMLDKHELAELAPRDIVVDYMRREHGQIFLDARHLEKKYLITRFPTIYEKLLLEGIDMSRDLIPVMPIQHYQIGGIKSNHKGRTNIDWLFAVGECSSTRLHGKNRLASNSLLECGVFALKVASCINKWIDTL